MIGILKNIELTTVTSVDGNSFFLKPLFFFFWCDGRVEELSYLVQGEGGLLSEPTIR